ncbi:MAG: AmmeMemoRadiSam system protein B [Melioribacteraceae bacterium]|nr:AmmeMemoRadiSam system protein B [Melioribacteraceae bacterium]
MNSIRKPAVSGTFYPREKVQLENEIKLMLNLAKSDFDISKRIFGLIVPHAGYVYSGKTAATAYNLIKSKNISTVIIISPSHREYFPGICVFNGDAYETPLGIVKINEEIRAKLLENSKSIFAGTNGHKGEHAIEVHIPFLQMILDEFSIVPITIGDQSKNYLDELAEKLSEISDGGILMIASTDLSHFYTHDTANELDSIMEKYIADYDPIGLQKALDEGKCEACGGGAVVALLNAAKKENFKNVKILSRTNSGDVTGDFSEVVGYLSAVIY